MANYCHESLAKLQFDHDAFNAWIQEATTETILSPPLCALPVVAAAKVDVNVDGSITVAAGAGKAKKSRRRQPKPAAAKKKRAARAPRGEKPSS
jgi:hypothetical protein